MILGISASGRRATRDQNGRLLMGATEELVKYVCEKSGEPYELITLDDKVIRGCLGCCKCAGTNVCVIQDDWAEIRDKMFEADAIVFGAPNYYGTINSLGHAFLERTFSLRHREQFPLSGKLNVIIAVGSEQSSPCDEYIQSIFRSNYMASPIGILRSKGLGQCYQCGYGAQCAAGAVVATHGFLDEIRDYHLPILSSDTYRRAEIIAHRLGEVVRANKK